MEVAKEVVDLDFITAIKFERVHDEMSMVWKPDVCLMKSLQDNQQGRQNRQYANALEEK